MGFSSCSWSAKHHLWYHLPHTLCTTDTTFSPPFHQVSLYYGSPRCFHWLLTDDDDAVHPNVSNCYCKVKIIPPVSLLQTQNIKNPPQRFCTFVTHLAVPRRLWFFFNYLKTKEVRRRKDRRGRDRERKKEADLAEKLPPTTFVLAGRHRHRFKPGYAALSFKSWLCSSGD